MKLFSFLTLLFLAIGCHQKSHSTDKEGEMQDSIQRRQRLEAEVRELAKPVYIQAYTEIHELRIDVQIAEEGTLEKRDVLRHYNEIVGPWMGRETSFDKMKKRLAEAGDAYIDFKFRKEMARIALEKAAANNFDSKQ